MGLCDSTLLAGEKAEVNAYETKDRGIVSSKLFAVITSDGRCVKMNLPDLLKIGLVEIGGILITKKEFRTFVLKNPDAQLKLELLQKRGHFIADKNGKRVVKYGNFEFVVKSNGDVLAF